MPDYTTDVNEVLESELSHIQKTPDEQISAMAISGGGIRSASFAMGVLQALVNRGHFKKFDYLSTVSGGGYLGSSLTWWLSQKMPGTDEYYGTDANNFPFGSKGAAKHINESVSEDDERLPKNAILDFIRQHGNYLIPGGLLSPLSFLATVLRTVFVSFVVYFALITCALLAVFDLLDVAVQNIDMVISGLNKSTESMSVVALSDILANLWHSSIHILLIAWVFLAGAYSISTFFSGKGRLARYQQALFVQGALGLLLVFLLIFTGLAIVSFIHANLYDLLPMIGSYFGVELDPTSTGAGMSTTSSVIGAILAILSHRKQMESSSSGNSTAQIVGGAVLLLFGIFYGAYIAALHLNAEVQGGHQLLLAIAAVAFAVICNVNYFGLNRMYRDRLMETFMADVDSIRSGKWGPAGDANSARVQDMCQVPNQRPYHLINCNVVLTGSTNVTYKGRNGDAYLISPLYCGSHATGWRKTTSYMHNWIRKGLTLPTAMAISGAAANPHAGVGGEGVTTNNALSLLMSLLNLRLGFWASNPKYPSDHLLAPSPNYIYPGIPSAFAAGNDEDNRIIELTDGGHFEDLAVYELIRRRLDLIVVTDAGADPDYTYSDVANLAERVRVDFGANIWFDENYPLEDIMPNSDTSQTSNEAAYFHTAVRGFAIAKIFYTAQPGESEPRVGTLIYIKPTCIKHLSVDVQSYKRQYPDFPQQSTLDQFFDEKQFEAYREIGYQIGNATLDDPEVQRLLS